MRGVKILFLTLVFAAFGFLVIDFASSPPIPGNAPSEASLKARTDEINEWIGGLNALYQKTDDKTVLDAINLLNADATPAIPTKDGLLVLDDQKPLKLVVLMEEDSQFPMWKQEMSDKTVAARYFISYNSIVLKNGDNFGEMAKALTFVHELDHAGHRKNSDLNKNIPVQEFCAEEVRAHTNENRIVLALGGKAYDNFINAEMKEMEKAFEKNNTIPMPDISYINGIEPIFGPWVSELDGQIFGLNAWVSSSYRFIDRMQGENAAKAKTALMCSLYQNMGILH